MKTFIRKYPGTVIAIVLTLTIPIVLYWMNFDNFSFSKVKFSGWQGFSNYYNLYVSITSIIITVILTIRIIDISDANNNLQKTFKNLLFLLVKSKILITIM